MPRPLQLLIAEDDLDDATLLVRHLRTAGFEPAFEIIESEGDLKSALDKHPWDVLVSDHTMPRFNAVSALRIIQDRDIDLPVLVFSGAIDPLAAKEALASGARGCISKDNPAGIILAIERELAEVEKRRQVRCLPGEGELLDLNTLLAKMLPALNRIAGASGHLVYLPNIKTAWIRGNAAQIQQILISLCANAKNAMPAGGTILLETSELKVDERFARAHPPVKPGDYVLISVTDTGLGMSDAAQARLLAPSTHVKPAGCDAGHGLWVVREFVRENGGHILVHSAPGRGTSVKVLLPCAG